MRGKGLFPLLYMIDDRITPAYAGKSLGDSGGGLGVWDHPRLCGEKHTNPLELLFRSGSPPPMRGKVILNHLEPLSRRITPAYAGKSTLGSTVHSPYEDHPRLCGEKMKYQCTQWLFLGSPPPMRGKAAKAFQWGSDLRITPAYAGKRKRFTILHELGQDHPRLCGEKSFNHLRRKRH